MKNVDKSHNPPPAAINEILGLPSNSGHTVTVHSQTDRFKLYLLHNTRQTPYLLCLVHKGNIPAKWDDSSLRLALKSLKVVSVAASLYSTGKPHQILRKNFRTGDFDYIAKLESSTALSEGFSLGPQNIKNSNRGLKPLTHQLENVLFEIHSAFRDIDGLHSSEALDEICKLLYAKIYDEENSIRTGVYRFQRSIYCSGEECSAEIRQLYYDAVESDRAIFSNKIPSYDRSRGVFRDPLLASSAAIVRAVEILQHYDFSNSPIDIKGRAFQNVLIPAVRSGMGQYFTPKEIIDFIVKLIQPSVRELVLDPFCGSGHFLTSALDFVRAEHGRSDKVFHEFSFTRLHGIEKSDKMVRIAMTDMRLHGDGHSNVRCIDSLLPFANYPDLYRETFDVIMTNPPFGVDLLPEALSQLGPFEIQGDRQTSVSLEIIAIERCFQLLRPGGRLAIVIPDGILSNRNTNHVRKWISDRGVIRGIFSLPVETFSPFGANIKTSILIVRKLEVGEAVAKNYSIFLADIGSVGYDAAGRPNPSTELDKLTLAFNKFITKEGW